MNLASFISELEKTGIKLSVIDNDLRVQAPKGLISPEIKKDLGFYKSEIIAYLSEAQSHNKINKTKKVDFSLFFFSSDDSVSESEKYKLLIDASKFADENGFSGIWTPERHFYDIGGLFPNPSIIAAALSTITKNLKLRAGSVVLPLHNPVRVVEDWSVIDNLSNGRVELSFASGWHVNDFVFAPEKYFDRKDSMFNDIETVKDLWSGKSVIRKNGANKDIEITTHPKPLQKELPVWITAIGNPETYIRAGKIGANLMTCLLDQDISELNEKIKIYRNSLKENGFDAHSRKVSVFTHTFLGENFNDVREMVKNPFTKYLEGTLNLIGKLGQNLDSSIDPENMSPEDKQTILDFAFERYLEGRTLMGTVDSCSKIIDQLRDSDIDEVACLIDFGLDYSQIMNGLNYLNQLRKLYS